jgi:hypothetical protein
VIVLAEAKYEKALTVKTFAVGVILSVIIAIFSTWLYLCGADTESVISWGYMPVFTGTFMYVAFFTFIPIFITAVMPKATRFTKAQLTLFYSMIMLIPAICMKGVNLSLVYISSATNAPPSAAQFTLPLYSSLLGPTDINVLTQMNTGGVAVPWGAWAAPLAFWLFFLISSFLYYLFLASILRRQYVEVESLAFPLATYATEVINSAATSSDGMSKLFKARLFWMGTAISFIFGFFMITGKVLPNWPSFNPEIDFTSYAAAIGLFYFSFQPVFIGFSYLISTDVLLTFVVSFIGLYMIIPQILASIGLYSSQVDLHAFQVAQMASSGEMSWSAFPWLYGSLYLWLPLLFSP